MRELQVHVVKNEQEIRDFLEPHIYPRSYIFQRQEEKLCCLATAAETIENLQNVEGKFIEPRWIPVRDETRLYSCVTPENTVEAQLAYLEKDGLIAIFLMDLSGCHPDAIKPTSDEGMPEITLRLRTWWFFIHSELGRSIEEETELARNEKIEN